MSAIIDHLIESAVQEALKAGMPDTCCICGGPAELAGGFLPNDPQALGAPTGKTRVIVYAVCTACAEDSEALEAELAEFCALSNGGEQ